MIQSENNAEKMSVIIIVLTIISLSGVITMVYGCFCNISHFVLLGIFVPLATSWVNIDLNLSSKNELKRGKI
jgi:hypothetical protein